MRRSPGTRGEEVPPWFLLPQVAGFFRRQLRLVQFGWFVPAEGAGVGLAVSSFLGLWVPPEVGFAGLAPGLGVAGYLVPVVSVVLTEHLSGSGLEGSSMLAGGSVT